ncbi:cytochrome b/b6 domain-containing protein [Pseudoalteromonas sp. MMG022]|uniref:cytochrome b n=1 Tax=Pseudoalteromonas sp. MMG022 TaxID=2909978 RepID=UPI001F02484A|nr:cytochrome b/b6 domain-containing protein [Pseudoalteromonas sp. MMG022]MCF6436765.1 cytochrome b/b6 domain-containing protein [Pseudoalteromonas sp. MMG022]
MKMSVTKFDRLARVFHWVSAVVILWATFSGLFLAAVKVEREWQVLISGFNVSLTTVFIPIFFGRVVHALRKKKPSYQGSLNALQAKCAHCVHVSMYLLIMLIIVSGVLMMRHEFQVFGIVNIAPLLKDVWLCELFSQIHHYASYILAVLIIVHISAVVWHHYTGKPILKRML